MLLWEAAEALVLPAAVWASLPAEGEGGVQDDRHEFSGPIRVDTRALGRWRGPPWDPERP